ncbi:carbohydrate sulfotransferase 11-like [Penaeus chinensis]|uniref:carbohydrate sulfotransferase 11-like n=1 Tax=Penaeus chinensis TaxID=139456 RepID=UPI001FB56EA5|nr:carbohydrate sulfotransferase 11-like [Penaeus chinensis]
MRLYTRKNIKSLGYLLAGLLAVKIVIERADYDNQRRRASTRHVTPAVRPDLLDQGIGEHLRLHGRKRRGRWRIYCAREFRGRRGGRASAFGREYAGFGIFSREREGVQGAQRTGTASVQRPRGRRVLRAIDHCPLKRLRWLVSRNLLMCFNAKVGTSTWTQYLMEAGFPGVLKNSTHWHYTAERYLKPPQKRYSSAVKDLMKKFGKVVIVRDPFARIVSAYLDKIATRSFAKLSRYIIKNYRVTPRNNATRQPTFEEFVKFLVEHTSSSDSVWKKLEMRTDRHWFPYYANCFPCDIDYDVIATMETIHEDTRYIMQKYRLGLSDNIWGNHRTSTSSEEKALALFKTIPRNLTMALYQRYRIDFLMFGYSVEKYLSPPSDALP